jgi:membrane protease YdiL (CAAX protease family)
MRGKIMKFALAFEASLIVLAWVLGWAVAVPPWERARLNWQSLGWGGMATLPALLAMWVCTRLPWRPFRHLMAEVEENVVPLFAAASPLQLVGISLLAGIGEEALFRGVIQGWLGAYMDRWVALGVSSVLFGLGHFITPTYAAMAGLLGCYLGALVIVSDNLLVAMVVHALYDYVALHYLLRRLRGVGLLLPSLGRSRR